MSGFLGEAEGWRWIEGLMAIFTGVLWIACSLLVPETYAPVLLRIRAAKLSKLTGKVYVSKLDVNKKQHTMAQQFKIALSRPWMLLFREPIVFLTSIYMAIIYGTLYMMFPAFPIVFQASKGWGPGEAGLAFLGITVGMVFAVAYAMFENIRYAKVAEANDGIAPPEARLPMAIVGSAFIPVGLFWFAWTNGNNVHWIVPIIGSAFFAIGIVLVFLSLLNYLIDSCKFSCRYLIIEQHTDTLFLRCGLCCFRPGRKLSPAVPVRRRLPALHGANVHEPWPPLGGFDTRLPLGGVHTVPHHILHLRAQDPGQVQVRRRGRPRPRGNARQCRH